MGASAGNGQRLLDRTDREVRVHGRRELGGQFETFAPHNAEARQGEGHGVRARPQIDDSVPSLGVGHDAADLLDEGGTRRLHRRTRQNRAGRVAHNADDAALGPRGGGKRQKRHGDHEMPH